MSFSDSGARQRSPDSLDGLVRADDRLGVRQAGAVLTERLVAGCAATCKTQCAMACWNNRGHGICLGIPCLEEGTDVSSQVSAVLAGLLPRGSSRAAPVCCSHWSIKRTPMKPQAVLSSQFGYLRCIQSDVGCSEGANHRVGRSSKRAVLDPLVLGWHSGGTI